MAPKYNNNDASNSDIILLNLIYDLSFSIGMYGLPW